MVATEIERKFFVPEPANLRLGADGQRLRQGYLALDGDVELRLRIVGRIGVLTVKGGHGLTRVEVERELNIEEADALWTFTRGRRVEKVRHVVPLGDGLLAEVDVFSGALAGLCVAEVEFESEAAAADFVPPPWCGRELTGLPGWSNAELARRGRPDG